MCKDQANFPAVIKMVIIDIQVFHYVKKLLYEIMENLYFPHRFVKIPTELPHYNNAIRIHANYT